jgi:[amino group carrier protein]-lysine/ornithine hydrolase
VNVEVAATGVDLDLASPRTVPGPVEPAQAVRLVREMVDIPSLSGQERALADHVVERMRGLGFDASIDDAGNAVGEVGPRSGPVVMLLGHMDTVAPLLPVRVEGNVLHGRGSIDAKGPLAAFVCATAGLAGLGVRFVVVGAVEEETAASRGAHFLLDRYDPAAVVIGEPGGWSNVVIGYRGRMGVVYDVERPQAHTSSPEERAVEAALAFWNRLAAYLAAASVGSRDFDRPFPALCRLDGWVDRAHLEATCRIPPGFDMEGFARFLEGEAAGGTVEFDEMTPAVLMGRATPPARALVAAIRRHGGTAGIRVKTGTSDMNVVATRWRAPMVAYGPGDSKLDHTALEHLDLDEYLRSIAVLRDGLVALAEELAPEGSDGPDGPREPGPGAQEASGGAGPVAGREDGLTPDEEDEVAGRLASLGYLE